MAETMGQINKFQLWTIWKIWIWFPNGSRRLTWRKYLNLSAGGPDETGVKVIWRATNGAESRTSVTDEMEMD